MGTFNRQRQAMLGWLAVALLVLVGCSNPERASTSIHAIAPTGETWYRPPQPIWQFAVTNSGKCNVVWASWVEVRGGDDRDYFHAGGHIDWPQGILTPGQSVLTNMIVPAKAGSVWRGYVEFWPIDPQDLMIAQSNAVRFGLSVAEFCPHGPAKRIYNDEWHH